MARAVELVAAQREAEAQTLTETGMGARLMADVTATLNAFIAEENQKLELRNRDIDNSRVGLWAALALALSGAGILATHASDLDPTAGERAQPAPARPCHAERGAGARGRRAGRGPSRTRACAPMPNGNGSRRCCRTPITRSAIRWQRCPRCWRYRCCGPDRRRCGRLWRRRASGALPSLPAHRRLRLGSDLESASADELLKAVLDDIETTQVEKDRIRIRGRSRPSPWVHATPRPWVLVAELVTTTRLSTPFPTDGPAPLWCGWSWAWTACRCSASA